MRSLKRRVRRLEAIVFPYTKPRVVTEQDLRYQELAVNLLNRIESVYAEAIVKNTQRLVAAKERGKSLAMSNLNFGFGCTVRAHMISGAPLEFPAVVAEAYASSPNPDSVPLVQCMACRYSFPFGIGNEPFKQCPLCGGDVARKSDRCW
jgi:hypothetical protein